MTYAAECHSDGSFREAIARMLETAQASQVESTRISANPCNDQYYN